MAVTVATEAQEIAPGWLRIRTFDLPFIVGIAGVALLAGLIVVQRPGLFTSIFLFNLWLLGYHHVFATFTRLCFDRESFRNNRFLVLGLPPLVLGGVLLLKYAIGNWVLITAYLYWQWFHYTRQSYGISQVYKRRAPGLLVENERLSQLAFYLLPVWGILYRSHQDPDTFLTLGLRAVPVPGIVVVMVGTAAVAALGWWIVTRARMYWSGNLPLAHTLYMLSHFTVFYVGYIFIDTINFGWLVLTIWHNAQYIAFVWMYNHNRFRGGIDPEAMFLSTISQKRNVWLYLLICLGASTLAYLAIDRAAAALPALVVVYLGINFHHYIVDGKVWKLRKATVRQTLGIEA